MKTWIQDKLERICVFEEIQIASKTFAVMLIPVLSFIIILELFIPKSEIFCDLDNQYKVLNIPDLKLYILYLTASVSHIIISTIVISYLFKKLFKNNSQLKSKIVFPRFIFFVFLIIFLFLGFDGIHTNLSLFSHERVYFYLSRSDYFSGYFRLIPNFSHFEGFYIFSLIPFTLIILGLIIIVLTCFNIGKDLDEVITNLKVDLNEQEKKQFQAKVEEFHNYLYVLSFILATSTIATILFFHIPLSVIGDKKLYESFQNVSLSLGICWGVIFSLTMLAMCLYPYLAIQKKLRSLITNNEISENYETKKWMEKLQSNYIIYKNIKSIISVAVPAFLSLLAQFI
jgi:hypothetical protein